MSFKFRRRPELRRFLKGSSLLEVLVAATVITLTLIAVVGVVMYSVERTSQVRYQEQANGLSQDMMELFFKDRALLGWNDFFNKMSSSNRFCTANLGDDDALNDTIVACGVSDVDEITLEGAKFLRHAEISQLDATNQLVEVRVITTWKAGKVGDRQVSLTQQFRKIK